MTMMQKSTMRLALLLVLVTIYVTLLPHNILTEAAPSKRNRIQICGNQLSDTVTMICRGRFNSHRLLKRTSNLLDIFDYVDHLDEAEDDIESGNELALPDTENAWWQPHSRNSLVGTRRRVRGLADECCKKACSISEMKHYCLN
ncbi:probable insulin-like peptide 5 [Scaptodrosophila lebanonensis]|uniref:Probable insulin-like peptide 5 n=1 Tax=Drosophila lebanonensis TaxID=7225 RepID=A0A6J2TDW1_DROLE|nr:probable insulin-like peptide 5 [Scaptodrosophila lebanonensis]